MPEIELNLGNSKVKFEDIVAKGLSRLTIIAMFAYFIYIVYILPIYYLYCRDIGVVQH